MLVMHFMALKEVLKKNYSNSLNALLECFDFFYLWFKFNY